MTKNTVRDIPKHLIYEQVEGAPIFYRDYRAYLSKEKILEEITGSSYLQALICTQLILFLSKALDVGIYQILSNEVGLKIGENSWRTADIAIYTKEALAQISSQDKNKYLGVAPEVVIEIDTKAQLTELENPLGYYQEKPDQLLAFGTKKVIGIFTDTQKVMIAQADQDWQIRSWKKDVTLMDGIAVNISQMI